MLHEVPPAPGKRPTSIRHSPKMIALARTMYGDGDSWTPTQIVRYFRDQGIRPVPSRTTVELWVVPGAAERYRKQRESKRRITGIPEAPGSETQQTKLARMRTLRDAGLSYSGIATVMNLDYDLNMTAENVRYLLTNSAGERILNKYLVAA